MANLPSGTNGLGQPGDVTVPKRGIETRPPDQPYDDPDAIAAEQRATRASEDRPVDDAGLPAEDRDTDDYAMPEGGSPQMRREEQSAKAYSAPAAMPHVPSSERDAPLLSSEHADGLKAQWVAIQAAFIDEPQRAVQDADHLVEETMRHLTEMFSRERSNLEQQWSRGGDVSTEDLRQALQRYRSFFQRLLTI